MNASKNNVYLGRQPIFDRRQNLVAYELLYRSGAVGEARVTDDAAATAEVIRRSFKRIGIATVLGKADGFINLDAEMLFSKQIDRLPGDRMVLELLETVAINDDIIERCRQLKRLGFRLALDDVSFYSDCYAPLFEMADVIKIDLPLLNEARLAALPRLKVIVTLGDVSRRNVLKALGLKASAGLPGHGTEFQAGPYVVLNSYHCSRLNTNPGRLTPEMFAAVFRRARQLIST